jgi:hypothetical protein
MPTDWQRKLYGDSTRPTRDEKNLITSNGGIGYLGKEGKIADSTAQRFSSSTGNS